MWSVRTKPSGLLAVTTENAAPSEKRTIEGNPLCLPSVDNHARLPQLGWRCPHLPVGCEFGRQDWSMHAFGKAADWPPPTSGLNCLIYEVTDLTTLPLVSRREPAINILTYRRSPHPL